MNIPETLLKLPEKELKKILAEENIYKAKFVIYDEQIYEVEKKYKKKVFFTDGSEENVDHLQCYYKPLSFEQFGKIKVKNISQLIDNWTRQQWFNWCKRQFINSYGEEYVYDSDPCIYVHFPETTISNSMEQSHIIRDLYLKFEISKNGVFLNGLKRGTLTDAEVRNYYTFSHVNNGENCFSWADMFCFGETQISQLRNDLRRNRKTAFRSLPFFLEAVKEYLSWESLEGVPYRKIDDVIYDKKLWRNVHLNYSKEMLDFVIQHIESFTYTFDNNEEGYFVKIDDTSKETIANLLTERFPECCSLYLEGRSVERRSVDDECREIPDHILWKGEYRPFKLITTTDVNMQLPKRINNYALDGLCKTLEIKFNQFLKEKKLNEYSNTTEG